MMVMITAEIIRIVLSVCLPQLDALSSYFQSAMTDRLPRPSSFFAPPSYSWLMTPPSPFHIDHRHPLSQLLIHHLLQVPKTLNIRYCLTHPLILIPEHTTSKPCSLINTPTSTCNSSDILYNAHQQIILTTPALSNSETTNPTLANHSIPSHYILIRTTTG